MTKKDKLDLLMLLSALESYCLTSIEGKRSFPDYLIEQIGWSVEKLRDDVLGEDNGSN